jgi:DNA-binding transcriptional LysR family regulator
MDIDLARTFLAVVEAQSFVDAAKRVHVTQSTVSMRIKTLEERLGKRLFTRSKAGADCTPAGVQFQKHALAFMRIWQQARLEVGLPAGFDAALTIGAQYSLWDGFLLPWIAQMQMAAPGVALRAQYGFSTSLMENLVDGVLDIGVMYTPESRPGFKVERLFEEELVLISSAPGALGDPPGPDYVYMDWGPEFQADHSLNFPDLSTPSLYMELGALCLNHFVKNPASGYFPKRLVAGRLLSGALRMVENAPVFRYPAYVVYPVDGDDSVNASALRSMKQLARGLA